MSHRNFEKQRRVQRDAAEAFKAAVHEPNPNFKMTCNRREDCPSTGQHHTGCLGLASTLKRMKKR